MVFHGKSFRVQEFCKCNSIRILHKGCLDMFDIRSALPEKDVHVAIFSLEKLPANQPFALRTIISEAPE